jgi:hypothetical protein
MNSFHVAANFRQLSSGHVNSRGIFAVYLGKVSLVKDKWRRSTEAVNKLVDFYQKI